jgi:long-chain acyl-CoA synthetase
VIRFDVENLSMELPGTKRILSFDLWADPLPRTTTRKLKRFEIQRRVMAGEAGATGSGGAVAEEPTGEEAAWLASPEVQKAMAVVRNASKAERPVLPSSNLELDLGFDSMERVELVVALEREMDAQLDEKVIAQVYTVRELVDAVLQARGSVPSSQAPGQRTAPGWDAVLAVEPDDPQVLAALSSSQVFTFLWFVFGKLVALIVRVFFNLKVSGKEKLPKKGPFILSPNHQSFLDGPVVASQIPWRLFKNMFYVGTSEIFGHGALNYLGRTFRLVPVDPDSNLVNAMRAGAYGLKKGQNLVLYPEGERSVDGTPKKFKKGAAILAAHLKVPIYPVALEGFYDSWPRSKRFPRLAKLRVQFGDPIFPPDTMTNPEETYRQLTEALRGRVVEMWEQMREKTGKTEAAVAGD